MDVLSLWLWYYNEIGLIVKVCIFYLLQTSDIAKKHNISLPKIKKNAMKIVFKTIIIIIIISTN